MPRLDELCPGKTVKVSETWTGKDKDDHTITDYAGQIGTIVTQSTDDQSLVEFPNLPAAWFYDTDLLDDVE